MNPLTQSKNTSILPVLITPMVGCFALSPQARAVCQEGCDTSNANTFLGDDALVNNTTGNNNSAIGAGALSSNFTGNGNTANGIGALISNTAGNDNTANGIGALVSNTSGRNNIAIGSNAGSNLTTGNNNIDIFDRGVAGEANTIRIGKQGNPEKHVHRRD
jgi:hypothetical protein